MRPSLPLFSKAVRAPLSAKRAGKQYYKGTRQAQIPGGHRTGAPGTRFIPGPEGGRGRYVPYRLLDEKVRVYIAPPVEKIRSSPLKPYVSVKVPDLTPEQQADPRVYGTTPRQYYDHLYAVKNRSDLQ